MFNSQITDKFTVKLPLIFTFILVSSFAIAESKDLCLFERVLIVGASVSEGYKASPGGPGMVIAKTLNPKAKLENRAKAERKSAETLIGHKIPRPNPTIVMGLDLFFWDAAQNDCGEDFKSIARNFFAIYSAKKIPMIIGKLPRGVSEPSGYNVLNQNNCAAEINRFLSEECKLENNCLIYDPKQCFDKIKQEAKEKFGAENSQEKTEYLKQKMKLYFVDDLHPSKTGNTFCATQFISSKQYQSLNCAK